MKEVVIIKKSIQTDIKLLKHLRKMSQSGLIWGQKKTKKKSHLSLQEGRWFYVLQRPFFSLRSIRHFISEGLMRALGSPPQTGRHTLSSKPSPPPPQSDTCWGSHAVKIRWCFAEDWLRAISWATPGNWISSGLQAPVQHTNTTGRSKE